MNLWSALSDRDAIFTYIEADNPAAVLIDERIVSAARRLLDFPASGRVGPSHGRDDSSAAHRGLQSAPPLRDTARLKNERSGLRRRGGLAAITDDWMLSALRRVLCRIV